MVYDFRGAAEYGQCVLAMRLIGFSSVNSKRLHSRLHFVKTDCNGDSRMPGGNRPYLVCGECRDSLAFMTLKGSGRCVECNGSGVNPHLNQDEAKCRNCKGTGICPTCNGTGQLTNPYYRSGIFG